jgi:hypothetical protein
MAMNEKVQQEVAEVGVRLLDDAHAAWVSAEYEAERALHAWFEAVPGRQVSTYLAYCAALEREEAAARDLQRLCELVEPCRQILVAR